MSIVKQSLVGASGQGGDYTINDSLRFRSVSSFLERTPATAGNRQTWTFSFWCKIRLPNWIADAVVPGVFNDKTRIAFGASTFVRGKLFFDSFNGSSYNYALHTNAQFIDPSAWYHIVAVLDTTNATSSDRVRLYVNGERVTSFSQEIYPSLNFSGQWNSANDHSIGSTTTGGSVFNGHLAEINHVDGQALTADDFGAYDANGTWKAKRYAGAYGTNGFYLNATANSSTILDQSGNSNNWDAINMNLTTSSATTYDLMKDTPSLVDEDAGNFATWNPLRQGANVSVTDGGLKAITNATVAQSVAGTIGMSSGKWYWEVTNQGGSLSYTGIVDNTHDMATYIGSSSTGSGYAYNTSGQKVGPTSGTAVAYGATYTTNDVIGIALDMDAGTLTFYKNNASQGTAFSGITGTWFAAVSGNGVAGKGGIVNFGQRPFAYTPPTGFLKLNTFNLPDSTIEKGSDYFNTVLYNGNGGTQSIDVGFQSDLVWIKSRNTLTDHSLTDVIRGAGYFLSSNQANAENYFSGEVTAFDAQGFDIGVSVRINDASNTYVAWNWKANGSGVSNTVGTITSTVSANTTAGFSIVSWTGDGSSSANVGTGLSTPIDMAIVKRIDSTSEWQVGHVGNQGRNFAYHLELNSTAASSGSGPYFMGSQSATNGDRLYLSSGALASGGEYIAYCFAPIEGYSAFGKYTGNGSTDGPFIYTGFRPAWVMTKRTDSTSNWAITDTTINTYNYTTAALRPNTTDTETTVGTVYVQPVSNGFKINNTNTDTNASGGTYIYMAFAENPFKNSNAR